MDYEELEKREAGLNEWGVLVAYRGSVAHGMHIPNTDPNSIDDIDIMGICVPNASHYLGLKEYGSRGTRDFFAGEWDVVIYEAKKFISMLANGNPNVTSLLWLDANMYLKVTPAGQLMLDNRHLFVSSRVFKPFVGYAYSQLKQMEHFVFEGYMGSKRKALVEKYGYDCKNAAHCIRLLRMLIEFLGTGEMLVNRPDAQELLTIKTGQWTLEQVKKEADLLLKKADKALEKCTLPEHVDMNAVNDLTMSVVRTALKERGEI